MPRGRQPFPQHLQQRSSSSMVNLSSKTSSSTSVMNFQMKPPSNQSYYTNFKPFLPGEKVIGMKRPYPFSLDNSPGQFPFHTKYYPPIVNSNNGKFEATSSTSKATTFNSDSGTSNSREGPSNGVFARGFLTLAPPTTTSNLLAYHQASFEDSIMKQGGSGLYMQRPYYSVFPPPAMAKIEQASAATMANCKRVEVAEHIDLHLKL
ncbi:uncharacterized protein LOC120160602 [Hibiscus syriacus]|uniref:uncharacterized protein LOC120160602 n=1 Tax=Hibiscus syriacus TaxID=106335 RepID=UPI001922066D|nr:uncharacterized protein LOC120160602 [Hibiscus syriacus]